MIDAVAIGTSALALVTYLMVREMQLQRKLDRLTKELTLVVGPLHSNSANEILLGITAYPPNRHNPDAEYNWTHYYNFWDNIISNMFLTPDYIRYELGEYLKAKEAYWEAFAAGRHGLTGTFESTTTGQTKRETFNLKRDNLQLAINTRLNSLFADIDNLDKGFWNRLLKFLRLRE
jgi:hypothetical protein